MRVAMLFAISMLAATSASAVTVVGATRIRITSTVSPYVQVAEVQAFDLNGTNTALAANGGNAFAPTQFSPSTGPTLAVDGDLASFYQSSGSNYQAGGSSIDYLDVTLGSPATLSSLTIYGTTDNSDRDLYNIAIYNVSNDLLYSGAVDARSGSGTVDFGLSGGGGVGATVPEPASWALMVSGFGLVGLVARRRKFAIA